MMIKFFFSSSFFAFALFLVCWCLYVVMHKIYKNIYMKQRNQIKYLDDYNYKQICLSFSFTYYTVG